MAVLRIIAGFLSIAVGGLLGMGAANSIWHQFLNPGSIPMPRHILIVGDWTLFDYQVHLFLGLLSALSIAFVLLGLYVVFFVRRDDV